MADARGDGSPAAKRVRTGAELPAGKNKPAFLTPPKSASLPSCLETEDAKNDERQASVDLSSALGGEENGDGCGSGCREHAVVGRASSDVMTDGDEIRSLLKSEADYDVDDPKRVRKREGYLPWDDYFMAVAALSAKRSKDPNGGQKNAAGACIVDGENRIVGIGYDGFPRGCSDDCLPWASNETGAAGGDGETKEGDENGKQKRVKTMFRPLHTRDPYLVHAEVNAILNKCSEDVRGARMYASRFPCNDCAKLIIQSGIKEVIYMSDKQHCPEDDRYRSSRIMFGLAGVKYRQFQPTRVEVTLDFGAWYEEEEASRSAKQARKERDAKAAVERAKHRDLMLSEADYDPDKPAVAKKEEYLSWDDYFMAVAFLSAQRSKDPNTQVGACIVDSNRCIVGIGYNGFPRGCSDEHLPWSRDAPSNLHRKYPYVCHAEVNAVLNKCSADVRGATLFVALFPCNDCAKVIVQSGIREVVFLDDRYHDTDQCRASRIMLRMAGVELRRHRPAERNVIVRLTAEDR